MRKLTNTERSYLKLVHRDDLRTINMVRISPANSEQHEIIKARLAYELRKNGIDFVTEARINANRSDLFDISGISYEICISETEGSLNAKREAYKRLGIRMVVIKPTHKNHLNYEYYIEETKNANQ